MVCSTSSAVSLSFTASAMVRRPTPHSALSEELRMVLCHTRRSRSKESTASVCSSTWLSTAASSLAFSGWLSLMEPM